MTIENVGFLFCVHGQSLVGLSVGGAHSGGVARLAFSSGAGKLGELIHYLLHKEQNQNLNMFKFRISNQFLDV